VALYNRRGQLLLQRRKHELFSNMWDLAGASHPLHLKSRNESYAEAAARCIKTEFGVTGIRLRKIGAFNYFAPQGKKCENEHCAVIVGRYDGKVKPNPKVAYGFQWATMRETLTWLRKEPQSFVMWARLGARVLRNHPVGKRLLETDQK
jgi:isopentenyl-diphosphate delta-isomerase